MGGGSVIEKGDSLVGKLERLTRARVQARIRAGTQACGYAQAQARIRIAHVPSSLA